MPNRTPLSLRARWKASRLMLRAEHLRCLSLRVAGEHRRSRHLHAVWWVASWSISKLAIYGVPRASYSSSCSFKTWSQNCRLQ